MIKQNIEYEYKVCYSQDDVKYYKRKLGSKWYRIKSDTYYKETNVKFVRSFDDDWSINFIK